MNDEIKALAQCTRCNLSRPVIRRIAYAPYHEEAANSLVAKLVHDKKMRIENAVRSKQPRWFVAYHFYKD